MLDEVKIAEFPPLSFKSVANGSFQEGFEAYSPDHFPFRDGFRTIKALTAYKLFRQKDNNGIYLADGHLSKLDYPENLDSVKKATDRFRDIIGWYADENAKIYFSVIPDIAICVLKAACPSLPIKLSTEVVNVRAQSLYTRLGFRFEGEYDGDDMVFILD